MQILKEAPEWYIQHCEHCGAVLKYSECDIHVKNVPFYIKNKNGENIRFQYVCDTFICPCCNKINEAERKWFYEQK